MKRIKLYGRDTLLVAGTTDRVINKSDFNVCLTINLLIFLRFIFINDLPFILKLHSKLFADDTTRFITFDLKSIA